MDLNVTEPPTTEFYPIEPLASKRQPTVEGPSEDANIVDFFSDEELKNMAQKCLDDFVSDVKSRTARMKKLKEFTELYVGVQSMKRWPFQKSANVSLPILTYPMLQVQARLFDMVWPENGKIFYSSAASLEDFERADATEKFGNSYIRNKMPEMGTGIDDTLAQLCAYGSAFRRTYWDSYEGRVRSDWIPIEDFVVPHWRRSQDPSMRDVPRMTLVHHLSLFDLELFGDAGVFKNVDKVKKAGDHNGEHQPSELSDATRKIDGQEKMDEEDDEKERFVLEQHRRWKLPQRKGKHVAFDGKIHHVIITIDEPSRVVTRVVVREEDDPEDLKRHQREMNEAAKAHAQAMATHEADAASFDQVSQAALAVGKELPEDMRPEPPEPPAVEPMRKRGIAFFTHYRAFPGEGFYGLGFGDFLAPLAAAANTLVNQHIDGVTLRNAKPGFISRQLKMQRGGVYVQPGELIEVDGPTSALKEGILWMQPPDNDPTTMPLVQFLVGMADKVAGSSDIMSGQTSGANRTAKEIQILNSQLMKQISVLARRVKESFKHELDKIWRCWGVFLPDVDTADVTNEAGGPESVPVSRDMFVPDAKVMPAADPRMKFELRDEAQNLLGAVMQNPMLASNPMAVRAATEDFLRANDAFRVIAAMGPPPQPPPPPQPKPTFEEESQWLEGGDPPVNQADNDQDHLAKHSQFLGSQPASLLDKDGRARAENHLRHHAANLHRKMMSGPPGGPPMGPPGPPMGPPPGGHPMMGPPPGGPPRPPMGGPVGPS